MTARVAFTIVLLTLTAGVVVSNWACVIVSIRNRRRGIDRHHSTVPLVSIVLVALAWVVYPFHGSWMAFIPVGDIGNWTLPWLPVVLIREARHRK